VPPADNDLFPPTDAAPAARLAAIDPRVYARTRNAIDGAVTRLSPYLTHGFTDVPAVIATLRRRHSLRRQDKLVYELAGREYFHHLWPRGWATASLPTCGRRRRGLMPMRCRPMCAPAPPACR